MRLRQLLPVLLAGALTSIGTVSAFAQGAPGGPPAVGVVTQLDGLAAEVLARLVATTV